MGHVTTREPLLARFFGGEQARRDALDMNRRLASVYPAVTVSLVLSVIPGLLFYPWPAGPVWQLAGFSFLGALALPRRTRHPELVAIACWLMGVGWTMAAAWLAGPPLAYLWAAAVISLPFVAVIWPLRVLVFATVVNVAVAVLAAALITPDEFFGNPMTLVLPVWAVVLCSLAANVVARVDRTNRRAVVTDPLTGLGNRAALQEQMAELVAEERNIGRPVSLLVLDLDHFKALNDRLGHAQGDAAIRRTAIALAGELGDRGQLFRYGGEEFVALLPRVAAAEALALGDRLRAAVSRISIGGQPLALSGGSATATVTPGLSVELLFRRADQALYVAKEEGRDRIVAAVPEGPRQRSALRVARSGEPGSAAGHRPRPWMSRGLVRTRVERDHLRAVLSALHRPAYLRGSNLAMFASASAGAPWIGWGPAAVAALAAVLLDPAIRPSSRALRAGRRGGEWTPLAEAVLAMALIGLAIVVAETDGLYALPLILAPAFVAAAGYRGVGALLVAFTGAVVIVTTALLASPGAILENPLIVTLPIGLLSCLSLIANQIARSAMEHGAAAVVDPLTGALNRAAFEARVADLARECGGGPGTLIVLDLDHFKSVNDRFGHDVGDDVLVAVADRLQTELRIADALYRIGGEEFVVVLPGVDETEGAIVAERLRVSVARESVAEVELTISLGVAASDLGVFEYTETFDRADAALFEAKRNGRDRVAVAGEDVLAAIA